MEQKLATPEFLTPTVHALSSAPARAPGFIPGLRHSMVQARQRISPLYRRPARRLNNRLKQLDTWRKSRWAKPLAFLGIFGPGLIAANAGNDAGAVATWSSVGALFGFKMLWVLVLITISLSVVQEMCARMGAAAGKGLSDLIREHFGVRGAAFAMFTLLIANALITISEFAGIAAASELFGIPKYLTVPVAAVGVWLLITRGSYQRVEKIFLAMSLAFLAYPIAADPGASRLGRRRAAHRDPLRPVLDHLPAVIGRRHRHDHHALHAALYPVQRRREGHQHGSLHGRAQRNVHRLDLRRGRRRLHRHRHRRDDLRRQRRPGRADQRRQGRRRRARPFLGKYAPLLFGIGLIGASLLAAAVVPLSTAYAVCESFGFEHGVSRTFREAPIFQGLFTGMLPSGR